MKKCFLSLLLVSLCFLATGPLVGSAQAGSKASWWAPPGDTKLGEWTMGGDIRVRAVSSDHMGNLGVPAFWGPVELGIWNDIEIWRERARFWVQADLEKKVTTYFRIAQEIRWGEDVRTEGIEAGNEDRWAMILDNAWIQLAEPWDLPVTFRIGRQDLIYGQGFLIIDSDSIYNGDGSRTVFFDALKATVHLNSIKTNVDLLFSKIHEGSGWWENESGDDEDLYGIYATTTYGKPVKSEFYLFVRNQREDRREYVVSAFGGPDIGINHPKRKVYTWGSRLSGKWGNFKTAAEFAAQTGTIYNIENFNIINSNVPGGATYKGPQTGLAEIMAFAGYAHASYDFSNCPLKPAVMLGYWFYSGDDRTSKYWGGFDDMYAQAPTNGEFLLYSNLDLLSSPTTDWVPFMHSNMHFPKLKISVVPLENFKFEVTYMHLFAHTNTQPTTITNSQGGKNRGDYIISKLGYNFSKNVACHVLWEWFIPGDFYPGAAKTGDFGRFEISARF